MIGVFAQLGAKIATALSGGLEEKKVVETAQQANERQTSPLLEKVQGGVTGQNVAQATDSNPGEEGTESTDTQPQFASKGEDGSYSFDFSQNVDPASMDKESVKALQEKIGAGADGHWGPNSESKLNKYYANEGIEPPNATKLQGVLEKSFPGIVIKGQPDNYYNIDGKRPAHKTNELSSGGDVSPQLISSIENKLAKFKIPGIRITAGNDAYHQSDKYTGGKRSKSAHARGMAIDFTTDDPEGVWNEMVSGGWHETYSTIGGKKIPVLVSPDGKTRLLNEYKGKTGKTTGKHYDYSEGNYGYLLKRGK